jgi:hypothetical protein
MTSQSDKQKKELYNDLFNEFWQPLSEALDKYQKGRIQVITNPVPESHWIRKLFEK